MSNTINTGKKQLRIEVGTKITFQQNPFANVGHTTSPCTYEIIGMNKRVHLQGEDGIVDISKSQLRQIIVKAQQS